MLSSRIAAGLCLALLAAALVAPSVASAQATGTIEGTVTDAGSRRPLQGVQVSIVGTGGTVGALTNAQGAFRILNVSVGSRLVRARAIGYAMITKTVDVTAGGTATVDVAMSQSAVELTAIVTTGTGGSQVEARKLGNTVASIETPENAPISSFSDILQGREPGVMALPSSGTTGEGTRIRIRGNASLSQSNEPIVYVDGVRIDNGGGFGSGFVGTGGGGNPSRLDDIDPTTIDKVEVLKGAAAATLYGTEASNGVLLITTKRGSVGSPRWTIEAEQSVKAYPEGRIEDQWGFARTAPQATRLSNHFGTTITPFVPFSRPVAKQMFETGRVSVVSGQVSGGTPLVTYFGSVRGYVEDGPFSAEGFDWADAQGRRSGVFMKDLNNRYSGTLNVGLAPTSNFKIQSNALFTTTHQEIPENANSIYAPYTVALFSKPENAQCQASIDAGMTSNDGSQGNGLCQGPGNPTGASTFGSMRELMQNAIKQDARHFNGSVRTSYVPSAQLNFDATFGIDFTSQRSTAFLPFGNAVDQRSARNPDGEASLDDRTHQEITLSVNGGWLRDLSASFNSNLIFGAQGFLTKDNNESSYNQEFPGPGIEVIGGGASAQVFESFSSVVNAGYFAQEQLGFRDWFFVTAGGRYDYNSAFGKTSGGVFYPQASVSIIPSDRTAWNASFLSSYLSTLRLRAAIGRAGRQPGAFDKLTTYSAITAPSGSGLVPSNLGNPELRPEISTEWEVGAEFGLMQDRMSFGFTRWERETKDALYARQFPVTGGFRAPQLDNIGEMKAWGWDARVKSFVVNRPDLSVDVYANIGFLDQIVSSLGGAPESKVGGSYPRYRNFITEGYAPGSFFGAALPRPCGQGQAAGAVCLAAGQTVFDTDANGVPDTEAEVLAFLASAPSAITRLDPIAADDDNDGNRLDHYDGKPLPDFEGSFGASATIRRNWRVATNLEYRFGDYTISDLTGAFRRANPSNGGNTQLRAETEAVILNPASTAEQRYEAARVWAYQLKGLSPYDGLNQQFDGDFLRWRELSLTYIAPQRWAALAGASDMQITFAARNFMLWTKYPGVDPEVNVYSRGGGAAGTDRNFGESIDAFGFPIPRTFGLNIRLGF